MITTRARSEAASTNTTGNCAKNITVTGRMAIEPREPAMARQPLLEAMVPVLAYLLVVAILSSVYGIAAGIDAIRGDAVRGYVAQHAAAVSVRQSQQDKNPFLADVIARAFQAAREAQVAQETADAQIAKATEAQRATMAAKNDKDRKAAQAAEIAELTKAFRLIDASHTAWIAASNAAKDAYYAKVRHDTRQALDAKKRHRRERQLKSLHELPI